MVVMFSIVTRKENTYNNKAVLTGQTGKRGECMNCRNYKYEIIDAFKLGKDLADYCKKKKNIPERFF